MVQKVLGQWSVESILGFINRGFHMLSSDEKTWRGTADRVTLG